MATAHEVKDDNQLDEITKDNFVDEKTLTKLTQKNITTKQIKSDVSLAKLVRDKRINTNDIFIKVNEFITEGNHRDMDLQNNIIGRQIFIDKGPGPSSLNPLNYFSNNWIDNTIPEYIKQDLEKALKNKLELEYKKNIYTSVFSTNTNNDTKDTDIDKTDSENSKYQWSILHNVYKL